MFATVVPSAPPTGMSSTIRVLVVDDHAVIRAGLRVLLAGMSGLEIVAEAGDGAEALRLVDDIQPDVVIADLSMPVLDGVGLTRALRVRGMANRVLVLTVHDEECRLAPALEAGAAGYLTKSTADVELADAVRAVARGECYPGRGATDHVGRIPDAGSAGRAENFPAPPDRDPRPGPLDWLV